MTWDDITDKWEAERLQAERQGLTHIAQILGEVLLDIWTMTDTHRLVTLNEAALEGGRHPVSIGRMVRQGKIRNMGRKGAPRIRECDIPRKPGYVRPIESLPKVDPQSKFTRRELALAVISGEIR